jgi:hypothetical protein
VRTTLHEKVFINGFQKPSYVVASLALDALPAESLVRSAALETLAAHPRLRSTTRSRAGVPLELVPSPPEEWLERGGLRVLPHANLHALEEQLLGTPMDLARAFPFELYLVRDPPALLVKVHHAVLDATSGYTLLQDFARALVGAPRRERRARPVGPRVRRALSWLSRVRLRPRLPAVSLVTDYHPRAPLDEEPVGYSERLVLGAHPRIVARGQARGATFAEMVASAVMSAMFTYNAERSSVPPPELGLMFARALPRAGASEASFRAETCVVSVPSGRLATLHHPRTLRELRSAATDPRHNDVALAALYATRRIFGRAAAPAPQRAIHFTLSDVTAFARGAGGLLGGLAIRDMRVLASPTSFDHAGMIVSRFGTDVRLALIAHRGALDAGALLDATLGNLEE